MNSKERILTALNREEPDRVPLYTSLIDSLDVLRGYDDYSGGVYRVLVNGTPGSWSSWSSGVQINYPINTSTVGFFNYTIQYHDEDGNFGIPDTVIVRVFSDDVGNGNGDNGTTPIPGFSILLVVIISLISVSYILNKKIRNKVLKIK